MTQAELDELIAEVEQTDAEIKERDTYTPAKMVEHFGNIFIMRTNGEFSVRRSPSYAFSKALWVKHPKMEQITSILSKFQVAEFLKEDCRLVFILQGGIMEMNRAATEYCFKNNLIVPLIEKGWQVTAR